jgi:hypothetical protein
MDTQLEIAFVERIRSTYQSSCEMAMQAGSMVEAAVLRRAECGLNLIEAQAALPKSASWGEWIVRNLPFSIRTAQRMMCLAEAKQQYDRSEGATGLSFYAWLKHRRMLADQLKQMELLPEVQRQPGEQSAHSTEDLWLKLMMRTRSEIQSRIEKRPVSAWSPVERMVMKEQLQPLVDLHAKL